MIDFTVSSVITTIVVCNLFIILVYWQTKDAGKVIDIGFDVIIISIILATVRMILPLEMLEVSHNIYLSNTISEIIVKFDSGINDTNFRLSYLFLLVWFIGTFFKIIYLIYDYRIYKNQVVMQSVDITDGDNIKRIVQKYKRRYILSLKICKTKYVESPEIFGLFRQTILLPEDNEWSDEELEFVLAHEIAHYNNGDLFIKLLVSLMNCVFWWNPATLMLRNKINEMLEIRADDDAIKSSHKKIKYMEFLIKEIKKEVKVDDAPIMALISDDSCMKKRFDYMVKKRKTTFRRYGYIGTVVALFLMSYIIIFEPYYDNPDFGMEEGVISLNRYNAYMVHKLDGTYDIYYKDRFWGNITEMDESLEPLDVINEKDDWEKRIAYMFVTPDRFEKKDE